MAGKVAFKMTLKELMFNINQCLLAINKNDEDNALKSLNMAEEYAGILFGMIKTDINAIRKSKGMKQIRF